MRTLMNSVHELSRGAVIVIGDVMLDRYVAGQVSRISPEAPVPVLRAEEETVLPGGAANVAAKITSLGAGAVIVGRVGNDPAGSQLLSLLEERGVDTQHIIRSDPPTTVKTRYTSRHQQIMRLDEETTSRLPEEMQKNLLQKLPELLSGAAAVVLDDYGKGFLSPELCRSTVELCRGKGLPLVVEPSGIDYAKYEGAALVAPNRSEVAAVAGLEDSPDNLEEAAASVARLTHATIMTTLGNAGILLTTPEGSSTTVVSRPVEVYDITGAGDTVVAVAALGLASGMDLEILAGICNAAGAAVVQQYGVGKLTRLDILRQLGRAGGEVSPKVVDLERAEEFAREARKVGRSVALTNGCFDLLHPGHVWSLGQAAAQADVLVVGLNSDASVRRLKGPERPINDQESRATVLAAMEMVDLVVIFSEPTAHSLIEALRPDVYAKGADYDENSLPEADLVKSYGGRLFFVPLLPGTSTTRVVEQLSGGNGSKNKKEKPEERQDQQERG